MVTFNREPGKAVILIIICGLLLTAAFLWQADVAARRKLAKNFSEQALLRYEVIARALESDVKALEGLGRFFESDCRVGIREFGIFVRQGFMHFQVIGWLPAVAQPDLESFEARARREMNAGFQVFERDSQGRPVRVAGRSEYFPVYFIEPQLAGGEMSPGFDGGAVPLLRAAIERARDSGRPVVTEPLPFSMENGNTEDAGFFIMPVYDQGGRFASEERRRSAFKGVLLGVCNIGYVFQDSLKDTPQLGLNTTVFDRTVPAERNIVYDFHARLQGRGRFYYPALRFEKDFKFGQRDWRVAVVPSPGFLEKNFSLYHWFILPAGVFLTALAAFGSHADISQRRRLEGLVRLRTAELSENEGRLSQIVQGSSVATFVINNNHMVTHWNKACESLTGIPARDIVGTGRQWKAFYPEERPVMADLIVNGVREEVIARYYGDKYRRSALIEGACEAEDFFPHMRQGGRWLFFTAAPLKDAGGSITGAVETLQDITERKIAEEELIRIAAIKSEFTSVVSHELRIPLAAIKEGIGIVMDGSAGAVSDEQKEFLSTAKRNVDRLSRLINDVLDYQKLDAGRMDYDMKANDMNALVEEVIATMRPLAEKKYLDISCDLPGNLPKVSFDRDRIAQVLNNLVSNAIKFTEQGVIVVSTRKNENSIVVCVKDTGPGIRKEDMDKLFQSFSQVRTGKDRKAGGTGLGLAISKKIVQQHGGRIWAESEFGKWAAFYFNLPIVDRRRG